MAEQAVMQQELDALAGLEDRVQKAVTLVETLRRERDALARDLSDSQGEVERLSSEVTALRTERTQVRGRIEKLLGHIDQLSL
jgi:FtsZ-binding cell division protein ZapB